METQSSEPRRLKARAVSAGGWNTFITIATQALRLLSNLILTRLLLPEAFGMIALTGVFLTAIALFTDIGVNRSITREPDGEDPKFLRVAWVIKILRGVAVGVGVLVIAILLYSFGSDTFPAASVYAQPEMPGLIALTALSPILLGAVSTNFDVAVRRLEYRRFAFILIAAQAISIIAMVVFAMISPTVWALLLGMLVNGAVQCVLSFWMIPGPTMRWTWDRNIALRIWNFGKWLIGSSVLTFVARNTDKFVMGGIMTSTGFGILTIAQTWIAAGTTFVARLTEGVGFPLIAEVMRTRPDELQVLYPRYQRVVDLICVAGFVFCYFAGQLFIEILYTTTYATAGSYIQLLSPTFLLLRFDALGNLILNAGMSRGAAIASAIRASAVCAFLFLGYQLGDVKGALIGAVLSPAVAIPYLLVLSRPILGDRQSAISMIWLLASLVITGVVYATTSI